MALPLLANAQSFDLAKKDLDRLSPELLNRTEP
jgi:hypothetical protein